MEEQKPKSIRTVGLVVAIFSGFIIFINGMGAMAFSVVGMGEEIINEATEAETIEMDPFSFLFEHYMEMCLLMVAIGVLYLIGGIFLRKYKLWANKLVTVISGILILAIWTLMIAMSVMISQQTGMEIFSVGAILNAMFWSAPVGLLIRFLNRNKIKKHFA